MMRSAQHLIIEIPYANRQETVEVNLGDLQPDADIGPLLSLFETERAKLQSWIRVARFCYKARPADFVRVLEEAVRLEATIRPYQNPTEHRTSLEEIHTLLATYYTQTAGATTDVNLRAAALTKAAHYFAVLSTKIVQDENIMLAHAFFQLWSGDARNAKVSFNLVRQKRVSEILTQIGLAGVHLQEKNFREALQAFQGALRDNPNCPAAVRVGIGYCLGRLGRLPNAMTAFERALEVDAHNASALVGLAVLELNNKKRDTMQKGLQHLLQAYNADGKHPEALNHLANHYIIRKDYERARRFAQHAISCSGGSAEILAESFYHIARTFHVQNDFEQAFQFYHRAVENAPDFLLALYGLGQMHLHRKNKAEARKCLESVLQAEPTCYEVQKIMGSLLSESSDPADHSRAESLLKSVTSQHPDDVEAWLDLAALLERSNAQGALAAYGSATSILAAINEEIPAEVHCNIGCLHFKLGKFDEALAAFGRAQDFCQRQLKGQLSDTERDFYSGLAVTITYNTARTREELHDTETAVRLYTRLQETHKTYVHSALRLGIIHQQRSQQREAADWFSHAAALAPSDPTAWALHGSLHMARREWQLAQKKYEKILSEPAFKEDPYTVLALANVYLRASPDDAQRQKRNFELAQKLYCSVLHHDPHNVFAANGLGCVLAYRGDFSTAKEIFLKVREASPSDDVDLRDSWLNLAHCYVELGQYENAIKLYEKCTRRPGHGPDARVLTYLARAHVLHGQPRLAYPVLLRALHVNPADLGLRFNIAAALERMAVAALRTREPSSRDIEAAIAMLRDAVTQFGRLAQIKQDRLSYNPKVADRERRRCGDYLQQSEGVLAAVRQAEARQREKSETQRRLRAEMEERMRRKKEEEEEQRRQAEEAKRRKAEVFKQEVEAKAFLAYEPPPPPREKSAGGGGGRQRKRKADEDDFIVEEEPASHALSAERVVDSDSDDAPAAAAAAPASKGKRKLQRAAESDEEADAAMEEIAAMQRQAEEQEKD